MALQVSQQQGWTQIAHHFDLPDFLPHSTNPGQQRPVGQLLANFYSAILHPFEEMARRNMHESNRKTMMTSGRQPGVNAGPPNVNAGSGTPHGALPSGAVGTNGVGNMVGGQHQHQTVSPASQSQPLPQSPHLRHTSAPSFQPPAIPSSSDLAPNQASSQLNSVISGPQPAKPASETSEPDTQGIKRRLESEETEGKRVRQKTGTSYSHHVGYTVMLKPQ